MNVFYIFITLCLICVGYFLETFVKLCVSTMKHASNVIKTLLKQQLLDEELRNELNLMLKNQLNRLLEDKELSENLRKFAVDNVKILSTDENITASVTEVIQTQLESTTTSDRTRLAIEKLAKQHLETIVEQEWFNNNVRDQIIRIIHVTCDSSEIKDKIRSLIEGVADGLAKSDETNKIINDFLLKIVNDKEFMKQSGTAIRRSLKHAAYGAFWSYGQTEKEETKERTNSIDSNNDFTYVEIKKI